MSKVAFGKRAESSQSRGSCDILGDDTPSGDLNEIIREVQLEQLDGSPRIKIRSDIADYPIELLLDTGATISVIKYSKIKDKSLIDYSDVLNIFGITKEKIRVIGSISAYIDKYVIKFFVVPDNFMIPTDGILGNAFFQNQNVNINYEKRKLQLPTFVKNSMKRELKSRPIQRKSTQLRC